MWWHELGEVENECTSYNFSLFAIFLPKIVRVGENLTSYNKNNFACFLRHGVEWPWMHCIFHFKLGFRAVRAVFLRAFDFLGPPQKKTNKDRGESAAKMKANESSFWIIQLHMCKYSLGISRQGTPNDSRVLENGDAQTFLSKFPTLKPTLRQSLVSFWVIPKCMTLNDL